MFTEELVFLDEDLRTSTEVLTFSYQKLLQKGYVKVSYLDSILTREDSFPTGLMTHTGIHIAMPHTDAEHAEKEGIVFIRLQAPVVFQHMVDPDEEVETRLIFNIVVKDPSHQVIFLTKLMKMFQSEELLTFLTNEQDKSKIVEALQKFIDEN
ncbi:PTS sugar transporter subunit IIA [Streptococcus suis]|nr:PTS sugar transporter subunit IIA [Streptococcus suis]